MSSIRVVPVNDPRPRPADHGAHHPRRGSKEFINPWPSYGEMPPPSVFARAFITGDIKPKSIPKDLQTQVQWRKTDYTPASNHETSLKAVWLGHASIYLEFPTATSSSTSIVHGTGHERRGLRVLCDPVFSNRCSPSQWAGPKRYTPCPTSVDALPDIDLVLISHNHYDHLDHATIMALKTRFPNLYFIVPLGVKKWFLDSGVPEARVTQMDWWEEVLFSKSLDGGNGHEPSDGMRQSLRIGYLPAQHFTARGITDRFHTLWGSYSIESASTNTHAAPAPESRVDGGGGIKKVWFAGDTGRRTVSKALEQALESQDAETRQAALTEYAALPVCPAHAQIGDLRGPFDLALVPIGAYKPRHLMSLVHIDPQEAIDIYSEVKAKRGVGIHWGTFPLTGEDVLDPKVRLERLTREQGVQGFGTWAMGEMMYI